MIQPEDPEQPLTIVIDQNIYLAPRVGTRPQDGRTTRRATCGHDVYVSERGIDAIDRRGKTLVCSECRKAFAAEHGATLAVWPGISEDEPL